MSKHGRSTTNPQSTGKRSRIQTWLMQDGWQISEGQHPAALWIITATNPVGVVLVVVQPAGMSDKVEIQASVTISEPHQKLIAAMDSKERQHLLWGLRLDLLKFGVDFQGVEEPLTQVHVMQRMYDDGLTKDRFLQRVSKVRNAQILVIWTINHAFDQPPDDDVLGSGFIQ